MTWFGTRRHPGATPLSTEGRLPGFDGATRWLNSPYTCINWLRTLAYVRAWAENGTEGGIAFRFHARDAYLVLRTREPGARVPFRVLVDGEPPGDAHGLDVDEQAAGP
jgi:hypothetical protein